MTELNLIKEAVKSIRAPPEMHPDILFSPVEGCGKRLKTPKTMDGLRVICKTVNAVCFTKTRFTLSAAFLHFEGLVREAAVVG